MKYELREISRQPAMQITTDWPVACSKVFLVQITQSESQKKVLNFLDQDFSHPSNTINLIFFISLLYEMYLKLLLNLA